MLSLDGVDAYYGRAHILQNLSFGVEPGETLVLLGRNGAGKSTTLKTLIGLVPAARGRIAFAGQDITNWEPHRIARAGLGYVPEERRIFADLTVLDNLDVARQRPRPGVRPWTPARLFALFPNLAAMPRRLGSRMSGGEQQMLAIARTLMGNPSLLLLDEPSEGLAPVVVEQMAAAILALKAEGVAILLAEQNLRFAASVAGCAVVIEKGRAAWSGTLAALQADEGVRGRYLAV